MNGVYGVLLMMMYSPLFEEINQQQLQGCLGVDAYEYG